MTINTRRRPTGGRFIRRGLTAVALVWLAAFVLGFCAAVTL